MTDEIKISQLPAATLPLSGSELVPIVQSGVTRRTTVTDFNIGGGGGGINDITSVQTVSSGSTATAVLKQIVIFSSPSGAPKTLNAPAATGSFSIIEAVDAYGDAFDNPITFTPASGTVIGIQNAVYTNYGSARWRDVGVDIWANV